MVGVLRDHDRIHLLRRIHAKYSMLTRLGTKASATVALRSAIGAVYDAGHCDRRVGPGSSSIFFVSPSLWTNNLRVGPIR